MSIFSAFKSGNGETLERHYVLADSGWWNVHMLNGSLKAGWVARCQGQIALIFRADTTFNYDSGFIIWAVIIICVLILENSLWQQNEQPFPSDFPFSWDSQMNLFFQLHISLMVKAGKIKVAITAYATMSF